MQSLIIAALILSATALPAAGTWAQSGVAIEDASHDVQKRAPQRQNQKKPPTAQGQGQGSKPYQASSVSPYNDLNNAGSGGTNIVYIPVYIPVDSAGDRPAATPWDAPDPANAWSEPARPPINPKIAPRPTQPKYSFPNLANRPHPTNTNAPELTWNHDKGALELERPKTIPPPAQYPAPIPYSPLQTIAPAPAPAPLPPPPPGELAQPKPPVGWDVPIPTGMEGMAGMAGMNHDMKPPADPKPGPQRVQAPPAQPPAPKPTGWDVSLVKTGPGTAGVLEMNHDQVPPAPAPIPEPPPMEDPIPQFLVPLSN